MTEQEARRSIASALARVYEEGDPRKSGDWKAITKALEVAEELAMRCVAQLRAEGSARIYFDTLLKLTDAGYRRYCVPSQATEAPGTAAEVASIRYPQQFHELCRDLLHAEFPRVLTYEGSGGDAGVDGYDPDTGTIFQFHGPEFPIRKEKVKSYLEKASRHPARHWVLVSKRDLTPKQSAWLDSVRSQYSFAIEVWGPAKLNQLLDEHPNVAQRYSRPSPSTVRGEPGISVGAQQAAQIVNVVGPTTIKTSRRGIRTLPIPGTVGSDPFKKGELAKLIDRLAEFRVWDIGKDKKRSIFGAIHKNYLREEGCRVNDTPLDQFEEAVAYFRQKIDNTKLGRINKGKGYPNY